MSPSSQIPLETMPSQEPHAVRRRLEQVVSRIRLLHVVAGCSRVLSLALLAVVLLYVADRFLELPIAVRAALGLGALIALGVQTWKRIVRPVWVGVSRLEAARLVEQHLSDFDGRLVSSLQLAEGTPGSFEHQVAEEAARVCEALDLRSVLVARPSMVELLRAAGLALSVAVVVVVARPSLDVFFSRLQLNDTPWPRDTTLELILPERSPVHALLPDGSVVASRGGVLSVAGAWTGVKPERVELVVEGSAGTRSGPMTLDSSGRYRGSLRLEAGDAAIRVRGGDDKGDENLMALQVVEPPRLDAPDFLLQMPSYLGLDEQTVGPEGLSVPEGTRISLSGRASAAVTEGELQFLGQVEPVPLEVQQQGEEWWIRGEFVAETSDTLSVLLAGAHGLSTPDPSHHPLVVKEDRPPTLRIYAPPRSDIKVTSRALVPFAVVAEDDHGVRSVVLDPADGGPRSFERDVAQAKQYRHVLDLAELGLTGTFSYALEATDGRDLPGKGPQIARVEGRRIDIVDDSEVQRLLADRQLRLKESLQGLRERQLRASESLLDLMAEDSDAFEDVDGELVAAAVAQNQVSTRLVREARELCAILEETMTNRLDQGPGAEAILERRLADWLAHPVDGSFDAASWRQLASDYAARRYGRLDTLGRLLDMAGLALELSEELSPAAHEALTAARQLPGLSAYQTARSAQEKVEQVLALLLDRMDEWEDYQEVLSLVKTLIQDQQSLRSRTEQALKATGGN